MACAAFRAWLLSDADERLQPRDLRGAVNPYAYLEVELHAESCLLFLVRHFGAQAQWPTGGVRVTVFTRFDSEHRPPLTLRLLRDTGSGGGAAPLELHL